MNFADAIRKAAQQTGHHLTPHAAQPEAKFEAPLPVQDEPKFEVIQNEPFVEAVQSELQPKPELVLEPEPELEAIGTPELEETMNTPEPEPIIDPEPHFQFKAPPAVEVPQAPEVSLNGNVVRLELFLNPEQLGNLFRAIVANQHTVMTLREAASYLRINQSKLEQMAEEGTVPAIQLNGHWRFSRTAVDEWLNLQSFRMEAEA